jgi:superfamily II DNA or RNA helicase
MKTFPSQHLTVGGTDPFLPNLLQAINYATSISIAAAFIRKTGLNLIFPALEDALLRGATVRILTGDYMGITEPVALRQLILMQSRGAEIKVFESKGYQSFHMKAYLFIEGSQQDALEGCAFIGSSNISKSALQGGLEWNVSVDLKTEPDKFNTIRLKYEELYVDPRCVPLNHDWIDKYEKRIPKASPLKLASNTGTETFEPLPEPNIIQQQALTALHQTRINGYQRGLVVMATGTGKTWLAAFDSKNVSAKKILFVAHREEILDQAEQTFVRIHPNTRIGRYSGKTKQQDVDLLFASIQTIGKQQHLAKFSPLHFDYIVVDEFHHAAAASYQKLIAYFTPKFMLGLTATPERTDQSDILSLCDDNLVFNFGLFDGIKSGVLCSFDYQGIADTVDYNEISWRNGKFDPEQLENKLATVSRAKHNLVHWQKHKLTRTLAFCVSTKHADFMADYFNRQGINAVSVHSKSKMPRNVALNELRAGAIQVIFSVDLFNEGVDLPAIDTVMMLRPTDSKIIFLQQLGRGLRTSIATQKERLVILDFIGNHISFFRKVDSLFAFGVTNGARRKFLTDARSGNLPLPKGCFVNFELAAIDILQQLISDNPDQQVDIYIGLKDSFGRRPTLSELYHAGGSVEKIRKEYGGWFEFVLSQKDLKAKEDDCLKQFGTFLRALETTHLTKSFKLILIEAFLELGGLNAPIELEALSMRSLSVLKRHRPLLRDLTSQFYDSIIDDNVDLKKWTNYWRSNPVKAWIGENSINSQAYFRLDEKIFAINLDVPDKLRDILADIMQELVNYRFLQYENRLANSDVNSEKPLAEVISINSALKQSVPFFTDLKIAYGHFKSKSHEYSKTIDLPLSYGNLDPKRHFVVFASGNSMDGGEYQIKHGDLLLLEHITPEYTDDISGKTIAIERNNASGDEQYLLRQVKKLGDQKYQLIEQNAVHEPIKSYTDMTLLAFLKNILDPADVYCHQEFMRQDIPGLFGLEFNKGLWEAGHIRPKNSNEQFLLVTLNKQGKASEHQYNDYFIDDKTFHWQSQASTKANSAKGKAVQFDDKVHLFVRKNKLTAKTASPFYYLGKIDYQNHQGEAPMNVTWKLHTPLPEELFAYFKI